MAEVSLFHHAQGQTSGFLTFADELRRAGHTVHTPDLYDGRTFQTLDDGVAHAERIGFAEFIERGVRAADELSSDVVYARFSLGAPRRSGSPNPVRVPAGRCCSTPACRCRSSDPPGRHAELFLYPGDQHLFADASLPSYDASAAALLTRRVLEFLETR